MEIVILFQKNISKGCGFLEWIDPPMCKRSVQIIPGLLNKINMFEEDVVAEDEKNEENNEVGGDGIDAVDMRFLIASELRKIKLFLFVIIVVLCLLLLK